MTLPADAEVRKSIPLATGLLDYFPSALVAVAALSAKGNSQHNPGKPMRWDRAKSGDEADALVRHLLQRGTTDTDGVLHSAKVAWRALAMLQKELEASGAPLAPGAYNPKVPEFTFAEDIAQMKLQQRIDQQDEDAPTSGLKAGEAHHPFQDTDALTGHVTSPIGAQSGGVVDTTREAYVPNPPSNEDGS